MKPQVVVVIFVMLLGLSAASGIGSYCTTKGQIEQDISQALSKTLAVQQGDRITADTIRTYRQFIQMDELRDRAYLSMKVSRRDGRQQVEMVGGADCSMAAIYRMSDQRLSLAFLLIAMLWLSYSLKGIRQKAVQLSVPAERAMVSLGGLSYSPDERMFYSESHERVHLTPMQQRLMEMFFEAKGNRLSKQEICDTLWPKKPDANETLYTLIRRLKTVVEAHSHLKIESDRGRAYELTIS